MKMETAYATTWTTAWVCWTLRGLQRPGAIYDCGCDPILEGDCDCDGNQLDEVGVCGGECTLDLDMGICDDIDTASETWTNGICNGLVRCTNAGVTSCPWAIMARGTKWTPWAYVVRLQAGQCNGVCATRRSLDAWT